MPNGYYKQAEVRTLTEEDKREFKRFFQHIKSLTFDNFVKEMNQMHSRAYAIAQRQYRDAMFIVLPPRYRQAVEEKMLQIRLEWEGMLTVESTKEEVLDESLIVAENKHLKRVNKYLLERIKELEGLDATISKD